MSGAFRPSSGAWVLIPICAFAFLIWANITRIRRVDYVSGTPAWSMAEAPAASVGDAGWQTRLVVAGHDNESYEWLDQTRQMLALRQWRVRRVDYENAPFGREEHAASPYRWLLGLIAWADHAVSGRPPGASVERAALFADPLLHMLLLAGAATFVAWQLGVFPAAILSLGLVALFPFASEYLPGAPDDHGLSQACAIWSVLPLLAGVSGIRAAEADSGRRARRWFLVAGVAGGVGLWISVVHEMPVLLGIVLGALLAAVAGRGEPEDAASGAPRTAPWRIWALGGAAASCAAYLIEFFPAHMGSLQLRVVHPLYGLAWLGAGEVLAQAQAWIRQRRPETGPPGFGGRVLAADAIAAEWMRRRRPTRSPRDNAAGALALVALAAVPVAMWRTRDLGFMGLDAAALRLTRLPHGPAATGLMAWVLRDGLTAALLATLLPLLLIVPAIWLLARRGAAPAARASICIALGPVLVALGFACRELAWWNGVDAVLLALLVAAAASIAGAVGDRPRRLALAGFAALVLLPGAIQLIPRTSTGVNAALNETEVVGLVERDLARWLALHAGGRDPLVLAPFNETVTLYYYGGLRGLATLGWENREGFEAATRIAGAPTPEGALELVRKREITHIVLPSWDARLDAYAREGPGQPEETFFGRLEHWNLPVWLRPVAYPMPKIPGYEGLSVAVFEVVEDQDDATAESRLAEYFAETEQPELALAAAAALQRFPADIGALAARARVELTLGNTQSFAHTVDLLLHSLSGGADRALPWDRRVSLAAVLAQGQQVDLARMEVMHCLSDVDDAKLRALTPGSLYRLEVLIKGFQMGIADPRLRGLALDLLPPELRDSLGP